MYLILKLKNYIFIKYWNHRNLTKEETEIEAKYLSGTREQGTPFNILIVYDIYVNSNRTTFIFLIRLLS